MKFIGRFIATLFVASVATLMVVTFVFALREGFPIFILVPVSIIAVILSSVITMMTYGLFDSIFNQKGK